MVSQHHLIISSLIIIAVVVREQVRRLQLLGIQAKEIDFFVIKYFSLFILSQVIVEQLESFSWSNRVLNIFCLNWRAWLIRVWCELLGDLSLELLFQGLKSGRLVHTRISAHLSHLSNTFAVSLCDWNSSLTFFPLMTFCSHLLKTHGVTCKTLFFLVIALLLWGFNFEIGRDLYWLSLTELAALKGLRDCFLMLRCLNH